MWARNLALWGMQLLAGATVFAASPSSLPEGPGRKTLESVCAACHTLDVVTSKKWSREKWQDVVPKMDAGLSPAETADVVGYLARNFGPKDRSKQLVEEICSFCHGLERLQGQAFTRD